ncbi:hypothetical protein F4778DRAFT_794575 [Xylariomycetidae sp. FL2044]|nr:hypothetical protein F4778DRAFT_794575 [Xylariomycetidae sp. FL2044]
MPKVQNPDHGPPSRSDSFIRMLELEKKFKMQRIQRRASTTNPPPSTLLPSAQANPSPFRARRMSAHPPLSHQTQIMAAARRSYALPSLSISIPPSPATEETPVNLDGSPTDTKPDKPERTKTVTFEGQEEDDKELSDESSICQSPSWEQYGQKKKKKPKSKRQDSNQDVKEKSQKSASIFSTKGSRLSKLPPPDSLRARSLTKKEPSRSAPELDLHSDLRTETAQAPNPVSQDDMTNRQFLGKTEVNTRPKSKGLFSSFRLQHGNVAAVQKLVDSSRASTDDSRSLHNEHAQPTQIQEEPSSGLGMEVSFANPRKAPSIRSVVSTSNHSISSSEKRPIVGRHSGSSHGRSHSLLSSTLSKLKGPSYLYYHNAEDADATSTGRPSTSQETDLITDMRLDERREQLVNRLREQDIPTSETHDQALDFVFPPRSRRSTHAPATRGREPDANISDACVAAPREYSSELDSPTPRHQSSRYTQAPPPRAPGRQAVVSSTKQSRPGRSPPPSKQRRGKLEEPEHIMTSATARTPGQGRVRTSSNYHNGYGQGVQFEPDAVRNRMDVDQDDDFTFQCQGQQDRHEAMPRRTRDDDTVSTETHTSTICLPSRRQEPCTVEGNKVSNESSLSPRPSTIGRALTTDSPRQIGQNMVAESIGKQTSMKTRRGKPAPAELQLQPESSADYFAFVTEAYAPPSLELRSPSEGRFPGSPRIPELPEEEDEEDLLIELTPRGEPAQLSASSELRREMQPSKPNVVDASSINPKPKGSPAISSLHSDSDIPAFERLGISSKTAKTLAGVETASNSTSRSQHTNPSRSTSERSSSSTYGDAPPSPLSVTISDSSRPQSRKGLDSTRLEGFDATVAANTLEAEKRTPRVAYQSPSVENATPSASHSASMNMKIRNGHSSRTMNPNYLDNSHPPQAMFNRVEELPHSPLLVATPTSFTFSGNGKNEVGEEKVGRMLQRVPLPPRAQSALELHSANGLPSIKHHTAHPFKSKAGVSSVSLPNSPPPELVDELPIPRRSALKIARNPSSNSTDSSSALVAAGAAYLQEARKTAPVSSAPSSSRALLRPHYSHKNSSGSVKSSASHESRGAAEPLAKMLVECCSCKFLHDMPSRVYECMAKPDSMIEDKLLGVSAQITTMVKCPWCGHGMTTSCCAGWAAVIYLKEKMHGK